MANSIDVLKPGMRVRCKSYQTAGTFEGFVVRTEDVDRVLVKVDTVNGNKMASPFDRWTSFEGEVEDWDNTRYLILMDFQIAKSPFTVWHMFESDTEELEPGKHQGIAVKSLAVAQEYAKANNLVLVNKCRKELK